MHLAEVIIAVWTLELNELQKDINSLKQSWKFEDFGSEEKESYTENNAIRPASANYLVSSSKLCI